MVKRKTKKKAKNVAEEAGSTEVPPNDFRTSAQKEYEDGRDPKRYFGGAFDGQIAFLDSTARMIRRYTETLAEYSEGRGKTDYLGGPALKTKTMLLRLAAQMERRRAQVADDERSFEEAVRRFD